MWQVTHTNFLNFSLKNERNLGLPKSKWCHFRLILYLETLNVNTIIKTVRVLNLNIKDTYIPHLINKMHPPRVHIC